MRISQYAGGTARHTAPEPGRRHDAELGFVMGMFGYGKSSSSFEIPDRELAHLRVVILGQFRRRAPLMLTLRSESGTVTALWLHPSISVDFTFDSGEATHLNRDWLATMSRAAASSRGLFLTPEPRAD